MDAQDIQTKSQALVSAIAAEQDAETAVKQLQIQLANVQAKLDDATRAREVAQEALNNAINPPTSAPTPVPTPTPAIT